MANGRPVATLLAAIAGLALASTAFAVRAASKAPLVQGLDHVPVAVLDLDQAAADFARLGFVIKPGRAHADAIRNRHVKFPDGGGIELITADRADDALTADYVAFLQGGDGPAYWSAYAPQPPAIAAELRRLGLAAQDDPDLVTYAGGPPHRLFFGDRLKSPTDGPAYWAHPNTAYRLQGVWLAADASERELLPRLGARKASARCAPFDVAAQTFRLADGAEVMVAQRVSRPPAREIVGLTVLVRDLAAARRVLDAASVRYQTAPRCGGRSLWIETHNLWLELRQ